MTIANISGLQQYRLSQAGIAVNLTDPENQQLSRSDLKNTP
jgi:hypothetical protein